MDDIVALFLAESAENLARVDQAFVALEQDPGAQDVLADVFRTIHTIKGTCGFLGLAKLERLSHSGESLLARVRDGERSFDERISQALFDLVDAVRAILASLGSTGAEGEESYQGLIARLEALSADAPQQPGADALPAAPEARAVAKPAEPAAAPAASIRVDVQKLDRLMDLAGELVLARNQLSACAQEGAQPGLRAAAQRLSSITEDLQQGVMRTRMQPIGDAWSSAPRLVRDLCTQVGKNVRLELSGADTAVDRAILEALRDPLTHMVRNAIDHGIEPPAERARAGKPETGVLSLRARTQGGQVRLDIEDDGAGIDPGELRRRAQGAGLIDAAEAERMSDAESLGLIFRAGFSTAASVSKLSGRGVGMDVVKTNIERLGGSVHVSSRAGRGTRIELRIPLTLSVLSVLMIECCGERFALPSSGVVEVVHMPAGGEAGAPLAVHGAPVLRLRDGLLPLVGLDAVLDLAAPRARGCDRCAVVLESEARRFGLVVDAAGDIEEIVVKPLERELASLEVFAGATIQGDGRVALILDVHAIARRGHVRREREGEARAPAPPAPLAPPLRLLVCELAGAGRVALEISGVLRLEPAHAARVESSGGSAVLTWAGDVLPVLSLRDLAAGGRGAGAPPALYAICESSGRRLALALDAEPEVVQEVLEERAERGAPFVKCRVLLGGRPVALFDLAALVRLRGVPCRGAGLAA